MQVGVLGTFPRAVGETHLATEVQDGSPNGWLHQQGVHGKWLGRIDVEVRYEGRNATEDELRKCEEMKQVWNRSASKATFLGGCFRSSGAVRLRCHRADMGSNTPLKSIISNVQECVQGMKRHLREAPWNTASPPRCEGILVAQVP